MKLNNKSTGRIKMVIKNLEIVLNRNMGVDPIDDNNTEATPLEIKIINLNTTLSSTFKTNLLNIKINDQHYLDTNTINIQLKYYDINTYQFKPIANINLFDVNDDTPINIIKEKLLHEKVLSFQSIENVEIKKIHGIHEIDIIIDDNGTIL